MEAPDEHSPAHLPPQPVSSNETPRSQARAQALDQREQRKAERKKQALLDREREESFEAWRVAQAAEEQDRRPYSPQDPDVGVDSSDDGDSEICRSSFQLNSSRSTAGLEEQLAAERLALQCEEHERERLIAKLSPPPAQIHTVSSNETPRSQARAQALEQREQRKIEREKQALLDREREENFEAWQVAQSAEQEPAAAEGCNLSDGEPEDLEPEGLRSPGTSGLEQQLAAERRALEAEEQERARLIAQLTPPERAVPDDTDSQDDLSPPNTYAMKALRVTSPEGKGEESVVQYFLPERQGWLAVNYNGQLSAVSEAQSHKWHSRLCCLQHNFIYIFGEQAQASAEDIVLCDDTYAIVTAADGDFHIQNRHTAKRKVSFRAAGDSRFSFADSNAVPFVTTQLESHNATRGDASESALWMTSISDSESVILTAQRFVNRVLPTWVLDEDVGTCFGCNDAFSWHNRRHHCRLCGNLFCRDCASRKKQLPRHWMPNEADKAVRACHACASVLEHLAMVSMSNGAHECSPMVPSTYM